MTKWLTILLVLVASFALAADQKPAEDFQVKFMEHFSNTEEISSAYYHYHQALMFEVAQSLNTESERREKKRNQKASGKWIMSVILAYNWQSENFSDKWYSIVIQAFREEDKEKESILMWEYCSTIDEKSDAPAEGKRVAKLAYNFFLDQNKKQNQK